MTLQLKRAKTQMHSQQMALIAPIVIGCIDYLACGTLFTRAMNGRKIKLDVFFHQKSHRCLTGGGGAPICVVQESKFWARWEKIDVGKKKREFKKEGIQKREWGWPFS